MIHQREPADPAVGRNRSMPYPERVIQTCGGAVNVATVSAQMYCGGGGNCLKIAQAPSRQDRPERADQTKGRSSL